MSTRPAQDVTPLLTFHAEAAEREAARRRRDALQRAEQLVAQAEHFRLNGNVAEAAALIDQALALDLPPSDDTEAAP